MTAYNELCEFLEDGETVEAIVFGDWGGWTYEPGELGYSEPENRPVPVSFRRCVLSLEEAKPYMTGWSFAGGFGSSDCYAVHVWTNSRVIWVHEYDGSTCLRGAPRNPSTENPRMS
jgi:hypothetical protein